MASDETVYGCDECKTHEKGALEQIGEPTEITYYRDKGHETQTRYRCQSCGTHWINYIKSGLAGDGNTWAPTSAK